MEKKYKHFFGLTSGDIYVVEEDEIKNLDNYQIPLTAAPKGSCKKCFGKRHIGYNTIYKIYQPCRCVKKLFDLSEVNDVKIDTKQTNDEALKNATEQAQS